MFFSVSGIPFSSISRNIDLFSSVALYPYVRSVCVKISGGRGASFKMCASPTGAAGAGFSATGTASAPVAVVEVCGIPASLIGIAYVVIPSIV